MDATLSKAVLTQVGRTALQAAAADPACFLLACVPCTPRRLPSAAACPPRAPTCLGPPTTYAPMRHAQLAMQGAAPSSSAGSLRRTTSGSTDSAASDGSITISPRFEGYGPGRCTPFEASAAAEMEALKHRFVAVLDARGWGQ